MATIKIIMIIIYNVADFIIIIIIMAIIFILFMVNEVSVSVAYFAVLVDRNLL